MIIFPIVLVALASFWFVLFGLKFIIHVMPSFETSRLRLLSVLCSFMDACLFLSVIGSHLG